MHLYNSCHKCKMWYWVMGAVILLEAGLALGSSSIEMYQINPGNRSVDSNVTMVSIFEYKSSGGTAALYASYGQLNETSQEANVAVASYSMAGEIEFSLTKNLSHLSLSYSKDKDNIIIRWHYSYLPLKYNGLISLITTQTSHGKSRNQTVLRVSHCNSSVTNSDPDQSWAVSVSPAFPPANYTDKGTCSCQEMNQDLFYSNGTKADGEATCGLDAEWDGCEDLECWSGPTNITVEQSNTTVGAMTPFNCSYRVGYPKETKHEIRINDFMISRNYDLKSHDHGKNLSCQVFSKFTEKTTVPHVYSHRPILVFYPPENSSLSRDILFMGVNDSEVFNYSVYANPFDGSIKVNVEKDSKPDTTGLFSQIHNYSEKDNIYHIYKFRVRINSSQDYGVFKVCASTNNPHGVDCAKLTICNVATSTPQPDTATFSVTTGSKNTVDQGLSPPIIVAIVAGAIVITLIVVAIVIRNRRKQSSSEAGDIKEETVNVLYGSAQYQTQPAANPVKQETSNVLYASASGSTGGDLVEYAMAHPDGIASDDAVEYVTSNPDAENTGAVASATSDAEPSCSGNTSVYAQINKKGKVNDGYKMEMHDTSEATYTVVDKSNKRDKDNVPEVYAVVNKPRVKN